MRRINPHRAAALYRSGMSLEQVGRELGGFSVSAIRKALRRIRVHRRPVGAPRKADREKVARMYMDGKTWCEIAASEGVSLQTIYTALRETGAISPKRIPADLDDEALEVFLDAYWTDHRTPLREIVSLARDDMQERLPLPSAKGKAT